MTYSQVESGQLCKLTGKRGGWILHNIWAWGREFNLHVSCLRSGVLPQTPTQRHLHDHLKRVKTFQYEKSQLKLNIQTFLTAGF